MKTLADRGDQRRQVRGHTRLLSLLAAGLVVVLSMFGPALMTAPTASALTGDEARYVSMLAEKGIGPVTTYEALAYGGHTIAYDLRRGVNPVDEADKIWKLNGSLSLDQAIWEVARATVVFAPELAPLYRDTSPTLDMAA
jgi:hypothetical protein